MQFIRNAATLGLLLAVMASPASAEFLAYSVSEDTRLGAAAEDSAYGS